MSLHPVVCADSAVAESQNIQVIDFIFTGAANGTTGTVLSLIPAQAIASARVFLGVAGSTNGTTAVISAAATEALIKRPNGNSLSATELNIKTGLRTFINEVSTETNAGEGIVFAVGGLNVSDIVCAELVVSSGAVEQTLTLAQNVAAVRIPEPVALDGSSRLLKADGSAADLDTDKLLLVGGQLNGSASTVAGCFTIPAAARLALSSANSVKLRLCVQN